jgi:hypothetical protein
MKKIIRYDNNLFVTMSMIEHKPIFENNKTLSNLYINIYWLITDIE